MGGTISKRRETLVKRLALATLSILVALVAAELVLRAWFPVAWRRPVERPKGHMWTDLIHGPSSIPGLTYELRPNAVGDAKDSHVVVNAAGMRGRELREPKGERTLRIAVLGDSVGFGFRIEQPELFTYQLEDLLQAEPGRAHEYEVLNFSVTGYSSREEAAVLAHKALAFDPDLVLVAYYLNDPDFGPINALRMAFHEPGWWERFELTRLVAQKLHQRTIATYGGGDYFRWLHAEETEQWRSVPAAFARIRELAQSRGLHVVLAIFPAFAADAPVKQVFERWDDYPYDALHAQVRRAAEAERFDVIDFLQVYRASGRTPAELARDGDHPGVLGHRIAAETLARFVLEHHTELFGEPR